MAFDVGSVIAHIKADISNFQNGLGQAQRSVGSFKKNLEKFNQSISGFMRTAAIGATAVVGGLTLAGKKALEMAGNFEQSEIAFTTLLKDRQKALDAIAQIEEDAKKTPYNLPDLIKANQLLISAGRSTEEARVEIINLGNAIAATGGGTAELNRLAVNMQQIQAVGKASALDIKQFAFAGINIYKLLSESTGKTVEEIKETEVTYDMLAEALQKASDAGGMFEGAMDAQSKSLQGVIANIEDVIGITLKDIAVQTGLFDAVKQGAESFLGYIEQHKDAIIDFLKNMGERLKELAASEEVQRLKDALMAFGGWIMENREQVLSFLKGLAIAFGALLVIGTITALISALTNPITLIIAAIGLLKVAWDNNFLGIRDVTKKVLDAITGFFERHRESFEKIWEGISKIVKFFVDMIMKWWEDHALGIKNIAEGLWTAIKAIVQFALDYIINFVRFWIAIFTGDWESAWQAVKNIFSSGVENVVQIFQGLLQAITGILQNLFTAFKDQFEKIWNKAKEYAEKIRNAIKDAFNKDKHDSPSIMDVVGDMVVSANKALQGVTVPNYRHDIIKNLGTAPMRGAGNITVNVDLAGAFISDEVGARRMAETVGDDIIKKLRQNVRF